MILISIFDEEINGNQDEVKTMMNQEMFIVCDWAIKDFNNGY